ncbi:MAG: Zn-ribbon containing protein, partial [Candidatus Methanoperedens sp.]|nr:Zn-ribbon containing protein [Candidatus Methanoperedens sp.]
LYVRDITPESQPGKTAQTEAIPSAASKFIKEVDELLGNKTEPESKTKSEAKPQEIGERVESVRILSPGSYELNLESLLERDEIVMALKEDGTYLVHLPSVFQKKKHHER